MEEKTLSPVQREFRLQLAVVKHLDSCFAGKLQYLHIPNRGGDATDGYFKQMMGAKAGAADLMLSWNNGIGSRAPFKLECAMIELKAPGGTLSSQQNKFLSTYAHIGWHTALCRSVRQVHDKLVNWGIQPAYDSTQEPDYRSDEDKKRDAFSYYAPLPD